jgi:hypothetical protein
VNRVRGNEVLLATMYLAKEVKQFLATFWLGVVIQKFL